MKTTKLNFYELARTSHIKRWTIINTTKEQNLAEHQYNVAVIGMELYRRIVRGSLPANFIIGLLFHDSAEIRYGDIPTPGKAFIRAMLEEEGRDLEEDFFGLMDAAIMPEELQNHGIVDGREPQIAKLADLIEAAWWIRENGAGAHAKTVADKCWRAVEDFVHGMYWHSEVNPVLSDLGLPAVNPHERLTPP